MVTKVINGLVIVALIAAALFALAGCGAPANSANTRQAAATVIPVVQADRGIVAEGKVVPVRTARLSMAATGIVAEVAVAEGGQAAAGQTVIRLESARQAAAVAQAEAQLQRADASLAQLKAGPRKEEVAAAQAAVDAAAARLKRIKDGAQPAEVAAAKASLAEAQAALQKTYEGANEQQIIAAQADFMNAAAAVRQAQAAYDRAKGDPNIGLRPEALQLEQATNQYNAAQARLNDLKKGASAADIAGASARVQRAQAQLDQLTVVNPTDVAAAEAEVRRAQAQLDLLAAGARSEAIAAAEADVAAAKATLAQAKAALAETELKAPFAGTVAALNVRVGEQVSPGVALVQLADLTAWQIETDDLTEINVVRVAEGAAATLTFDAIPGLQIGGTVSRIKPLGENKQGDIVYLVVVQPAELDPRLRWNMTASVTIEAR